MKGVSVDFVSEFFRIFQGNSRAHGEYKITGKQGAKAKGQAKTIATPPSLELWENHLNGTVGLGVVPIRENNTCTWGAVDVDEYEDLDLEDLSFKLPAPLVLCRSKSGGAHIYLFTSQPVPAKLMRKKLALVARAIGRPNEEIFPKQDELDESGIGNWINLPYFNVDSTTRYCLKGGLALSPEDFIAVVGESSLNIQQLVAYQPDSIISDANDDEFEDAPPCLRALVKTGFPAGSRNAALFSMGVYARKKFASGWEDKVFGYNNRFMGPGSYSEVAGIIRSLNKKVYVYKCKDQPLLSVCDKEICIDCNFGVQRSNDEEKSKRPNILDEVIKVTLYDVPDGSKDDPYYVFDFGKKKMNVAVDIILSQTLFKREYFRIFKKLVLPIKDTKWRDSMNALTDPDTNVELEIMQLAPDSGPEGQMWIHLEDFCTNKSQAKVREELLLGKPWHNEKRTYFRSGDFLKYLDQQRFRAIKAADIFPVLKSHGAKHHDFNLKGKHTLCWSVSQFEEQSSGFDREPMNDNMY